MQRIVRPSLISIFKDAIHGWKKDRATVWSAALAYYTVFSLAPLLLLLISIAGLVFSKTTLEKDIAQQVTGLLGKQGASLLLTIIDNAKKPTSGAIGSVISTITLILGALGVFGQLQQMLNSIWGIEQKPSGGIGGFLRSRLLNFSMIGVIAFLLLVSLVASSGTAILGTYFTHGLVVSAFIIETINISISYVITTLLFGIMFKVLPDVKIKWRYVWIGSIITALLFTIGKEIIGIYIGHSGVASEYGAAGSLIILLLWVYYSTQIVFFGSEVTKAVVLSSGEDVEPNEYAQFIPSVPKSGSTHEYSPQIQEVIEGVTHGAIKSIVKRKSKTKH